MVPDESGFDMDDDETAEACGHPACSCAAGESGYCSVKCEAQGEVEEEDEIDTCACGHADCQAESADLAGTGS